MAPMTPTLTIAVSPNSGHPPFNVMIAAAYPQKGGVYTLNVEGEDPVESTEGVFTTTVDGWPWNAKVVWSDETGGFSEAPVVVKLENETPVAHGLYTVPGTYDYHQLVLIDLRYMQKGCIGSGEPEFYTGIEDPDFTGDGYSLENDGFTYNVKIIDVASGRREAVFYGPNRTLMGDEYVECPIFYWFVGYSGAAPIIPYQVWSPMGCNPTPVPGPEPGQGTVEKKIHVYVKEFGTARHWVYTLFATASGCS